tara:strand:- start:110 stop:664 length:555 start_codon:yes stop_codon:yes gene_type:complete
MKIFYLIILLLLVSCNKPKTVLICGDHICINKMEAEQYFEKNLSIEVKIINNKKDNEIDLVELNLENNKEGKREVKIISKNITNNNLKVLTNDEISKIKEDLKLNKHKKIITNKTINKNKKIDKRENKSIVLKDANQKNISLRKKQSDVTDICTIIQKCSIDEISKYLRQQGKKKKFPDITIRQ